MKRETVVLVHGLWLHGVVMRYLERRLVRCGYAVRRYSYPSVRMSLRENGERLAQYCRTLPEGTLNFVAHSMGGLVTLKAAEALPPGRVGRIVLCGTPFDGSYSARRVQRFPGGCTILGRCIDEWLTGLRPAVAESCDLGVIAGTGRLGLGRLVAPGLPKPNDGVISVDETRVPGMRDHIVLPVSHTLMLVSPRVAHQVCAYLDGGKFDRARAVYASVN